MKTCCIVVIGHVDHGKTALVRALTGIETDRLTEEKTRGLSITLGFAHHTYPGGIVDFIDAPGHADFVRAMVSGATGAQGALLVVSAPDGIGAQTREHLRIVGLLGITTGVVAVTKVDLVPVTERPARLAQIQTALADTALSHAPVIACSTVTGDGLDRVHVGLQAILAAPDPTTTPLGSVLPIDRVFSLQGRGTVVTGTLLGSDLRVGQDAVVQPGGQIVVIRDLQSRGENRTSIHAGERTAANIRGLSVDQVARGAVLCANDGLEVSRCMDTTVELLPDVTSALKHMEQVRIMMGTASEVATVRLIGVKQLGPAQTAFAQLHFQNPVLAFAGQRAVLRRLSPAQTIGGATILDPLAVLARSKDQMRPAVLDAAARGDVGEVAKALCHAGLGIAKIGDIARLSRKRPSDVMSNLPDAVVDLTPQLISTRAQVQVCRAEVMDRLATYHAQNPLRAMAPRTTLQSKHRPPELLRYVEQALAADGVIHLREDKVADSCHDPSAMLTPHHHARLAELERTILQAGLKPPDLNDLLSDKDDADLLDYLVDIGRAVSLRNVSLKKSLVFHSDTLALAVAQLRGQFPNGTWFKTGDARAALATSRKVIVPLLEHFDSIGLTTRKDNDRKICDPV